MKQMPKNVIQKCADDGWKKLYSARLMPPWWGLQVVNISLPNFENGTSSYIEEQNYKMQHDKEHDKLQP